MKGADRQEEYGDILMLLLDHCGGCGCAEEEMARRVAASCLGENHLWEDMGLESREELSELIKRHFRPLFEKNTGGMKWKKFFYKQVCEREGFHMCKSPSCGVCADYNNCFEAEQ